jgi:guanylate kinase
MIAKEFNPQQQQEYEQQLIEVLTSNEAMLASLIQALNSYANLEPILNSNIIFKSPENFSGLENLLPAIKVVIAFIGTSSSGKNTIIDQINKQMPMQRVITTTTRKPRNEETEKDYHFVNHRKFAKMDQNDQFAEKVPQGDDFYGTQTSDLKKAIDQTQKGLIAMHVDPTGAINLRSWMKNNYPDVPFLAIGILPELSLEQLISHIKKNRNPVEVASWRIAKALWELIILPEACDVIAENKWDDNNQGTKTANAVKNWLCQILN